LERFALLLSPLAPHLGEECWNLLGKEKSIFENPFWFEVDEKALIKEKVNIAIQINGKLRATIEAPIDSDEEVIKSLAFETDGVKRHIDGKTIVKQIYVKNKILNLVVK